ncbi:hypothetical protein EGR_10639 [Echinococcus granulosus]|uniref:Uncharacterized protein n=1 Tax=Echinococcus granulosus TaxID=6210 RepID=W6U0F8_ECHGR|nr:hypothetical protein EGR_10639 [Echinococcus granulosus]EUB54503.1 hypothetical protein EGR_10639 [Echinococcus granulosus]
MVIFKKKCEKLPNLPQITSQTKKSDKTNANLSSQMVSSKCEWIRKRSVNFFEVKQLRVFLVRSEGNKQVNHKTRFVQRLHFIHYIYSFFMFLHNSSERVGVMVHALLRSTLTSHHREFLCLSSKFEMLVIDKNKVIHSM